MPYASNIANHILYTPLDSKAVVDSRISSLLTEEVFLKECYVPPRFLIEKNDSVTDINEESYDYIIMSHHVRDLEREQKKSYENFCNWLNVDMNTKIYTISGHAGTGKTTFVHKLKQDMPQYNWIILDITNAKDFVDWFYGVQTRVRNFKMAYGKMYAIVLDKISALLFNSLDQDKIVQNLHQMINQYHKHQKYYAPGDILFRNLDKALQDTSKTSFELVFDCAQIIQKYFITLEEENQGDYKNRFRGAMDVLLLIYSFSQATKKHIIVFDNVERFVAHDEIYNKDLDQIRRDMKSYSDGVSLRAEVYNAQFKFILVMRSSSVRMSGARQQSADELPSDVNLTDWFHVNDIIQSKQKWYIDQGIYDPNIDLLIQILCDMRICKHQELTGLQLFIDPLFNDNKRLIIEFIGSIIEKSCYQQSLKQYQQLWKEDTPISRFGARSIIRGIIYQELDSHDNLFQHLLLYSHDFKRTGKINYGLGYVRKILTILYNHELRDLTLESVISELCHINTGVQDYWNNLPNENKESITEVLYHMNSYNRRINDWIQFIDLQISGKNVNVAIRDKQALRSLMDNDLQSLSIQIMPAGKAYIRYIVPSFEYFAYRFNRYQTQQYDPLFCLVPTKSDLAYNSDVTKLSCVRVLNYVKSNAIECIQNVQNNGDIRLFLYERTLGKKHAQRIIALHQGYIDKFIDYLKEKYGKEDCPNLLKLIQICISIKNEYNNIKEDEHL